MRKININISKPSKRIERQVIDVLPEDNPNLYVKESTKPGLKPKSKLPKFSIPKLNISKKFVIITLSILIFGVLAVFAYSRFSSYSVRVQNFDQEGNVIGVCTNIVNPECWTDAFKPQLKQTNGFTSALILGLDTRPNGSLLNTDTIIIASYNHSTRKTMLVSIPRDFFSNRYQVKISAVYAYTHNKDKDDPFKYIKEEVASITGLQINYVVKVYLDGVTKLVDAIGGVDVCPYADFTAKYPNPNATRTSPDQWLYIDFKKGCQPVDGFNALVYARFRHIRRGPGELASDFSRADRQQEVIEAVKNKLLTQELTLSERAENYWAVLQVVDQNIQFDATFEDFLAGIALIDDSDKTPAKVVLDPWFGGLYKLIYENLNDTNGYTERSKDKSYKTLRDEITSIWNNIDFYKESPKIMVRNQAGINSLPSDHVVFSVKNNNKYWNRFDVINDPLTDKYTGIKLFDLTGGTKPGSLEIIKAALGVSNVELLPETYGVTRSDKNEDFLILIGSEEITTNTPAPSN